MFVNKFEKEMAYLGGNICGVGGLNQIMFLFLVLFLWPVFACCVLGLNSRLWL